MNRIPVIFATDPAFIAMPRYKTKTIDEPMQIPGHPSHFLGPGLDTIIGNVYWFRRQTGAPRFKVLTEGDHQSYLRWFCSYSTESWGKSKGILDEISAAESRSTGGAFDRNGRPGLSTTDGHSEKLSECPKIPFSTIPTRNMAITEDIDRREASDVGHTSEAPLADFDWENLGIEENPEGPATDGQRLERQFSAHVASPKYLVDAPSMERSWEDLQIENKEGDGKKISKHGTEGDALETTWKLMQHGNFQEEHALLAFRKRIPLR